MTRPIDADELKEYFHNPESGVNEFISNTIANNLKWEVIEENEEELENLCKDMIKAFENVIDTAETYSFIIKRCKL